MIKILLIGLLIFSSCKKEEDFNPYLEKGNKSTEVKTPKYLYKLDGKEVSGKEIPVELGVLKYKEELKKYLAYYNAVEAYAVRMALKKDRGMNDITAGEDKAPTLNEIFEHDISESKIEEYIQKNKDKFSNPNASEAVMKASARYELMIEHITPVYMKKRNELYNSNKLHVNILPPDLRQTGIFFGGFPRLGKPENKLELMVITNFLCENCRDYNEQITKLYEKFGSKLSYVHVNHGFRPGSVNFDTMMAAHCVNLIDKKKYWFFHKKMYDDPIIGKLTTEDRNKFKEILKAYLSDLKLDEKRVFSCMGNSDNSKLVLNRMQNFNKAGVKVLPMFYLNGRQLILLEKEGLEAAFNNMSKTLGLN